MLLSFGALFHDALAAQSWWHRLVSLVVICAALACICNQINICYISQAVNSSLRTWLWSFCSWIFG